jgi:hypothetical protein
MQTLITKHHDVEMIHGYLSDAHSILTERGYSIHDDRDLFLKVIDLLSARSITLVQPQPIDLGQFPVGIGGRQP